MKKYVCTVIAKHEEDQRPRKVCLAEAFYAGERYVCLCNGIRDAKSFDTPEEAAGWYRDNIEKAVTDNRQNAIMRDSARLTCIEVTEDIPMP